MRIVPLTKATAEKILATRRGRDLATERVVTRIVAGVRRRGDTALLAWGRRLDGLAVPSARELWVSAREIVGAQREVNRELLCAIRHAARNIRRVAERQKPRPWTLEVEPGVRVGQFVRPLDTIGCYIPGGRFSLVSTLLMTVIPAQVAGVRRIVVACPRPNTALLAAAGLLGVREIARIGGTQAVAALAYGTETIPRVDKIFGPGNRYVTAAKQLVSADCAIDMLAGPTEVFILASRGNPRFIAADLLAQAEHDPDAISLFITTSRKLARAVLQELKQQLRVLPEGNCAARSLARNGWILLAPGLDAAVEFANRFAPEHLSLPGGEPGILRQVEAAGSAFLGRWSAQPFGDYASGANHVLPTGGWARARGGLSVADYVKCSSVQRVSRAGLKRLAPVARALAEAEGLAAHRRAVAVREETAGELTETQMETRKEKMTKGIV
ncbi:MAG: histidinol dehydrogenase [Acidobacteria bacterium]|nr:histidinol dehydrogenase [Acidobacteriota bacterium]